MMATGFEDFRNTMPYEVVADVAEMKRFIGVR